MQSGEKLVKKIMTNAERIRQMNDEELAVVIMCPYDGNCAEGLRPGVMCNECCLKWLKEGSYTT